METTLESRIHRLVVPAAPPLLLHVACQVVEVLQRSLLVVPAVQAERQRGRSTVQEAEEAETCPEALVHQVAVAGTWLGKEHWDQLEPEVVHPARVLEVVHPVQELEVVRPARVLEAVRPIQELAAVHHAALYLLGYDTACPLGRYLCYKEKSKM